MGYLVNKLQKIFIYRHFYWAKNSRGGRGKERATNKESANKGYAVV